MNTALLTLLTLSALLWLFCLLWLFLLSNETLWSMDDSSTRDTSQAELHQVLSLDLVNLLLLCYHTYWLTWLFYTNTRGWERAFRTPSRKSYTFFQCFFKLQKSSFLGTFEPFSSLSFILKKTMPLITLLLTCVRFVSELVCDFLWCVLLNMPSILNFIQ